ncbi:unnamed protein product [Arctia plantaginis]|uniref:Charged multivesicular body protein 2a n=1 Tax=Arctia plantaginis TaxID=874455 RepID=A0A8S0ZIU0_ARCPL|nr:unnamed protein product [Arctia plantaginis]
MTPEEMMRKNQRALNKAMRDLDRERMKMEQQEKKVIADIKKLAKEGQMDAVKIMAKDLVRTRRYVRKFMLMKANIQAVSLKIQTLKSQNTMAQAMRGVTRAMATMNRQLNMPQIQKILQEFEKQSEIMDMKEEMMNDSIDEAMEADDDEEESDAVVSQILDELGLQLNDTLSGLPQATGSLSVPAAKSPTAAAAAVGGGGRGRGALGRGRRAAGAPRQPAPGVAALRPPPASPLPPHLEALSSSFTGNGHCS